MRKKERNKQTNTDKTSKTETSVFYNLPIEVKYCHFCHVLLAAHISLGTVREVYQAAQAVITKYHKPGDLEIYFLTVLDTRSPKLKC